MSATSIALLEDQYNGGADPAQVLLEMAEFTHLATRLKLAPETAHSAALTPEEKRRGLAAAEGLTIPALTRAWQILMKGVDELRGSQRPLQAADMVLVRLAYAADMPTPGDALKRLGFGGPGAGTPQKPASATPPSRSAPVATSAPAPALRPQSVAKTAFAKPAFAKPAPATPSAVAARVALESFEALVAMAEEKREIRLKIALESDVRLLRFEQGRIEFELAPGGSRDLASTLMQKLQLWTDGRWMVSIVASGGAPTLKEKREAQEREQRSGLEADPVVASVLAHFPGAQIIAVRSREGAIAPPNEDEAPEVQYDDLSPPEED